MTPEQFLRLVRTWTIPVIVFVAIGAGIAYAVSLKILPLYRAQGSLLVNTSPQPQVPLDVTQITSTYAALLVEPPVLQRVSNDLGGVRSVAQLKDEITATPTTNTLLIDVAATDADPQVAAQIVNQAMKDYAAQLADQNEARVRGSIAGVIAQIATLRQTLNSMQDSLVQAQRAKQDTSLLQQQINSAQQQLFQLNLTQLGLQSQQSGSQLSVSVAADASVPTLPASPNKRANALLGGFAGLLIGIGLAVLLYYFDQRLRDEEDVRRRLGLPTLAVIRRTPSYDAKPHRRGATRAAEQAAEAFRQLRAHLDALATNQDRRSVVITSARVGEGKSHTSAGIARIVAATGRSVCLIDANLRWPSQHTIFDRPMDEGLAEMLADSPEAVPTEANGHQSDVYPTMNVITSGTMPANPSELLASQRSVWLLRWLERRFDLVIIDTPAIEAVSDALSLSTAAAATILVIDPGRTNARQALKALEALQGAGANVVGVVLNRARVRRRNAPRAVGPQPSTTVSSAPAPLVSSPADLEPTQAPRGRQ